MLPIKCTLITEAIAIARPGGWSLYTSTSVCKTTPHGGIQLLYRPPRNIFCEIIYYTANMCARQPRSQSPQKLSANYFANTLQQRCTVNIMMAKISHLTVECRLLWELHIGTNSVYQTLFFLLAR